MTFDSPDQGANGVPTSNASLKDHDLHFEIPGASVTYDGTLDAAKGTITGTWKQSGASVPLNFTYAKDAPSETRRPQDPVKPYPYREEDVSFSNPKASGAAVTLAGTLTLPAGAGPFPAAILISGSGAHDRDEAVAGHRPFLVIADYLTRHGIAVLRYDKRGVARSTGDYAAATSSDFASDA